MPSFITPISEAPRTPKPMDNMLDAEFAKNVEAKLLWSEEDADSLAFTLSDDYNRLDEEGNLTGPFVIFIPYPSKPGYYLCEVIYYLPINDDGKMIASKTPRVALLAKPVDGRVQNAYVVLSALPCPFTVEDRVRPMQANHWMIWEGKANGTLVNLAIALGFEQSDFSPKKKKENAGDDEKTGIRALQSRFSFKKRYQDEAPMIADLESRFDTVERWTAMSQPITKEAREHLLATGQRLSPLKKKAESSPEKKKKSSHKKKHQRDASPSRKPKSSKHSEDKSTKKRSAPIEREAVSVVDYSEAYAQIMATLEAIKSTNTMLLQRDKQNKVRSKA